MFKSLSCYSCRMHRLAVQILPREPARHPMRSMHIRLRICATALVLLVVINAVQADEPRQIRGRVVDQAGMPVAGATVGHFWRANGSGYHRDGKPFDSSKAENVRLIWGNVGARASRSTPTPITGTGCQPRQTCS